MIGKKLIILMPNMTVTIQEKASAKAIKAKLLESESNRKHKNIIISAMCNNGILYVFKNIDMFLVINSISYKEIEKGMCENISVIIHQYPKMSRGELKSI